MYTGGLIAGLLVALSISLPAGLWSSAIFAQAYPVKPIKLINPFGAGGGTDLVSRGVARIMSQELGQQVVVDNRPGAGGRVALEAASRAPGDGYTLVIGTGTTLAMAPLLFANLPYDPLKSFAPISLLTVTPVVIAVHSSVPANTLKELIDLAKAKPGQLNYSSVGHGSQHHFAGESLKMLAGIDMLHIPYQGAAAELIGLLSGQVQVSFDTLASYQLQNFQSGKLRALAVGGPARLPQLPSVPTAAEAGLPGFQVIAWYGLLTSSGTSASIVKRLNAEVRKALAATELRDVLLPQGLDPAANSPEEFSAWISDEIARWSRVMKAAGFKPESGDRK